MKDELEKEIEMLAEMGERLVKENEKLERKLNEAKYKLDKYKYIDQLPETIHRNGVSAVLRIKREKTRWAIRYLTQGKEGEGYYKVLLSQNGTNLHHAAKLMLKKLEPKTKVEAILDRTETLGYMTSMDKARLKAIRLSKLPKLILTP